MRYRRTAQERTGYCGFLIDDRHSTNDSYLMFLYSKMKFSVLLIQSKLPGATAAIIGNIRIAAKTFASNAFIYCFSKTAIFNYTYRFTRMILHLFSFAGCLHMTFKRAIHQSFIVFPQNNLIIIYIRIKT